MITERNTIICDECGLFCGYDSDSYTPFGCSSYDPPEPLDPSHVCKKCWPKFKKEWVKKFRGGSRDGDWQKSRAEIEAAKECGLEWVGSGGHGMLGTKDFADSYQYISQKEFRRLKKLPYWGYCEVCGSKNEGGYCSNPKCEKTFKSISSNP